jgi:aminopeptidase
MFSKNVLIDFCLLTLTKGVNLQKGQNLQIICPVERREVALAMSEIAFRLGAKDVKVNYEDDLLEKIRFSCADKSTLSTIPKWLVDSKEHLVKENYCYVAIDASDPNVFKDIDTEKLSVYTTAKGKALKKYMSAVMENQIRWCVVSVPTLAWAKKVFPNSDNPEEELSIAIQKCMRLDTENPLKEWDNHAKNLDARAKFLNENNFEYLHITNALGTNVKVYLANSHVWTSAKELAKDGIAFIANMPTEEVFTAPHKLKTTGVIKSALPLSYNGNLIEDFSITVKNGKIVDFSAKKGYDVLKGLIETDKGTHYLGEIALIPKSSPIAKLKTLFYNTLFDENASVHVAIGKGYPTTIKNGDKLSKKELKEKGLNDSIEHVDFMIGTKDLSITGVKSNGEQVPVFVNGDWAF